MEHIRDFFWVVTYIVHGFLLTMATDPTGHGISIRYITRLSRLTLYPRDISSSLMCLGSLDYIYPDNFCSGARFWTAEPQVFHMIDTIFRLSFTYCSGWNLKLHCGVSNNQRHTQQTNEPKALLFGHFKRRAALNSSACRCYMSYLSHMNRQRGGAVGYGQRFLRGLYLGCSRDMSSEWGLSQQPIVGRISQCAA